MQLSPNQKIFGHNFFAYPKPTQNFKHFEKKDEPQRLFLSEVIGSKKQGYLNAYKAPCQNTYGQSTCYNVRNTA